MEVAAKLTLEKPQTNKRWMTISMITLGIAINYVDRVNFSVAAPLIIKEFDIHMGLMGILMSAFFWTYTIGFPWVVSWRQSMELEKRLAPQVLHGVFPL